jgi:hypothetical protein
MLQAPRYDPGWSHLCIYLLFYVKYCVGEVQSTLCCRPIDIAPHGIYYICFVILGQILCEGSH